MEALAAAAWNTSVAMAIWLLIGAIFAAVLHVVVPRGFLQRHFTGTSGVFKAVAFGVPIPLCSCGVIPAGIGLKDSGADEGAAMAFMISTPQTGVDSILVTAGMLGWPLALWKVLTAVVTGLVGGLWISGNKPASLSKPPSDRSSIGHSRPPWREGVSHGIEVLRTIYVWVIVGILASAVLEVWLPPGGLTASGLSDPWVAMFGALALSVPLYVCATASVPVAAVLVQGGLPLGAALVFLLAGPATNVATIGAISRAFGRSVAIRYVSVIVAGSLVFAVVFESLFHSLGVTSTVHHAHDAAWYEQGASVLLIAALAYFLLSDLARWGRARSALATPEEETQHMMQVEGMSCGGCVRKARGALESVEGVSYVEVTLTPGAALVRGEVKADELIAALVQAGFKAQEQADH